jgi:hypothetical protein
MSGGAVFRAVWLLALSYALLELVLRQLFERLPDAFHAAGVVLVVASTPWSLLALELFRPAGAPWQQVLRDFGLLMIICAGVAFNAALLNAVLAWIIGLLRRA